MKFSNFPQITNKDRRLAQLATRNNFQSEVAQRQEMFKKLQNLLAQDVPPKGSEYVPDVDKINRFFKAQNCFLVIGVDEAGRGCMFGPVVTAAACIGFIDYDAAREIIAIQANRRIARMQQEQLRVSADLLKRELQETGTELSEAQMSELGAARAFAKRQPHDSIFQQDYASKTGIFAGVNNFYQALQLQLDLSQSKDLLTYSLKDQDSKKISEKRRSHLFDIFTAQGEAGSIIYAIDEGTVEEINQMNILHASLNSMSRAVLKACAILRERCLHYGIDWQLVKEHLLICVDGNQTTPNLPADLKQFAIVRGDTRVKEISVASVLAKTYRDRFCENIAKIPPYHKYNLEKHKGYVTSDHKDLLELYGPTDLHRRGYAQVDQEYAKIAQGKVYPDLAIDPSLINEYSAPTSVDKEVGNAHALPADKVRGNK